MSNGKPRNERLTAFLTHLGISTTLILILLAVIFFVWYPHDFILVGGTEGLMILAGVDLVIGPLLTLIIFNPRKRRILITFDLICIGITQVACMAYGMSLIYQQRPILQILADDGVHIYTLAELKNHGLAPDTFDLPGTNPHNLAMDLPDDPAAINQLRLVHEIINQRPFPLSDELHVAADGLSDDKFSARLALIKNRQGLETTALIDAQQGRKDCIWLPLFSIHAEGIGCYSRERGVIDIVRR